IPEDGKYSITELEYQTARDAKIPVFAFFVDPDIPWPLNYVEWDKKAEVGEFKNRVAKAVTFKTFKSPADLKTIAVTALASFASRYERQLTEGKRFGVRTELVGSFRELRSQPDVTIEIGLAPDRLPMLLNVRRSMDIQSLLEEFNSQMERSGVMLPQTVVA